MNLNKSQKKIARTLIDRTLEKECGAFLENVNEVLHREKTESNRERYLELYKLVRDFDKHIAYQYDGLSGSYYLEAVPGLFRTGILSQKDIEEFDDEIRHWLIKLKKSRHEEENGTR